jgi:hypothetical protein
LFPAATPTVWQWAQFVTPEEATEIDDSGNFRVILVADGSALFIHPDCGTASGSYTVDGPGQINFDLDASGLTCDADSLAAQLVQHLNEAVSWHFDNGGLVIELPADGGSLIFEAPAGP